MEGLGHARRAKTLLCIWMAKHTNTGAWAARHTRGPTLGFEAVQRYGPAADARLSKRLTRVLVPFEARDGAR
jgi:hypothetical protein